MIPNIGLILMRLIVWAPVLLIFLTVMQPTAAASETISDLSGNHNEGMVYNCSLGCGGLVFSGCLDSYILVNDSPSLDLGAHPNTPMYKIAIISDVHMGQAGSIGEQTLPSFVELANTVLHPDIVLTTGDCFEHTVDNADHFLDIMQNLSCPWYYVWGDHDWGGAYPYDGRDDETTLSIQSYMETMGVNADFRRYTYLDVDDDGANDFMLVVLPPTITDDDLSWFDSLPTDAPMIVVHHVPAAMNGWLTYDPNTAHANMLLQNAETVRQHFEDKGTVFMVISGHDHGYVGATQVNGIWYVNTRRTGSTWGSDEGYNVLDFYTNGTVEFYTKCFDGDGSKDNFAELRTPEYGFSIEVVFKPTVLNTYNYLFDKGVAGNRNYGMAIKGDGAIYAVSHDTRGEVRAESRSGLIANGTQVHAIVVANSTSLRLFVNGENVAERPACPPYTTNDCPLYIGRTYSYPFNGTIRLLRIYNRPLTDAQVGTIFNGSYSEDGLVLYYYLGTPPRAMVTLKHTINNAGSPTHLNGSASYDPDGSIRSWMWDFGDGSTATGAVVSHTYVIHRWNGSYQPFNVSLTVIDDDGATNSTTIPVAVYMAGDANGDGVSNVLDAAIVGLHWNARHGSPNYHDGADLNNDDVVNILDAAIVGLNWNGRA